MPSPEAALAAPSDDTATLAAAAPGGSGAVANAPAPDPDKPTDEEKAAKKAEQLRRQRLLILTQRIDENPDFATTKESVIGLQKISRSERAHARALVDLIHDDPAMASKLLRLVNAAYYSQVGGGQITNLQRAVAVMGFTGIGMLTTSLVMFQRLPKGADGDRLRREFARSQLAAILAHEFCHDRKYFDSIYIGALFHRLGELLAGLHLGDEMQVIEDQLDDKELALGSTERTEARDRLVREHWGVSLEDLAIETSSRWGWPPLMQLAMRPLPVTDPEAVVSGDEYFRMLCTSANDLAGQMMLLKTEGTPEEQAEARAKHALRYGEAHGQVLGLSLEALPEQLERSRQTWVDLMNALGLNVADGSDKAESTKKKKKVIANTQEYRRELAATLANAVDQLGRMNQKGTSRDEVLEAAIRLMHEKLDLQRAIVCLRDPAEPILKGHLGVGERALVITPHFHVPLHPPACVLGLLCLKNADTLIADTGDHVVAQRLPDWFHKKVRAGSFLLLPIVHQGVVMGLLYGDQPEPKQLLVHDRAMTLLKDLRQQVLKAMLAKPAAESAKA